MNLKKWYKKRSALEILSIVVLIISVIMIIIYFVKFHAGLSDDLSDWGSFGDYFGSVAGLLAFLGVLYSLIQSNKATEEANEKARIAEEKANWDAQQAKQDSVFAKIKADRLIAKATEDAIRREERDLFFKLLELHQEKLNSVFYKEKLERNLQIIDHNDLSALEKYAKILNNIISRYAINDCIIKTNLKYWYGITYNGNYDERQAVLSEAMHIYGEAANESIFNIYGDVNGFESDNDSKYGIAQQYLIENILQKHFYKNQKANEYFKEYTEIYLRNGISVNTDEMFKCLSLAANILNEEHGHLLEQYFKNLKFVLNTIDRFVYDKKYYYNLYRAQLSRNEILLIFFFSLSDKSNINFVNLLYKENILDDMYHKDLFYTINDNWYGQEKIFISGIFEAYIKEHSK